MLLTRFLSLNNYYTGFKAAVDDGEGGQGDRSNFESFLDVSLYLLQYIIFIF